MRSPRAIMIAVALVLPVQASAEQGLGLRAGGRATSVREELLVPLTFTGGGMALEAAYRRTLGPGTLDAQLGLGFSLVANRFEHLGLTLDHALAVGYVVPVHAVREWRFSAGASVGESSDSLALESWDDAHGYWVGVGRLGALGRAVGPIGSWRLETTAEVAVLGVAGRPDEVRRNKQDPTLHPSFYLFDTFADPQFFTPLDLQWVQLDLSARPGRTGWSFGWQGRLTRANFPETIIIVESVVYAGWTWGL